VPGIHVFLCWWTKTWMAGTSPAMTVCEARECAYGPAMTACEARECPYGAAMMAWDARVNAL
jgi:hypothetical protein